jgi:hypothetical protein
MTATNNRRVTTAHSRIQSAIEHLEFLLMMNRTRKQYTDGVRTRLDYHAKFSIKSTLYDLKNAKTLLEGTTFKQKGLYGRNMKVKL